MKLLQNLGLRINLRQLFDDGISILNNIASYLINTGPEVMKF